VTWAIEDKSYSQRRVCRLIGMEPKTYRYASTRGDDGTASPFAGNYAFLRKLRRPRARTEPSFSAGVCEVPEPVLVAALIPGYRAAAPIVGVAEIGTMEAFPRDPVR
jgi:hypothetical protein